LASVSLRLLGGFALCGPGGAPVTGLAQRRAVATLAILAVAGDLGCTRDRIIALLWPDSDEDHGRHSLRDALHAIRLVLGADAISPTGETLRLNGTVTTDVQRFAAAVAAADFAAAAESYQGPLLDGLHVDGAPEFERWLDAERARMLRECCEALEHLAAAAERAEHWREAAHWWGRAVELDPFDTVRVVRRMWSLTRGGDRANALKDGEAHRLRLEQDLELEPDPAFLDELARIRTADVASPFGRTTSLTQAEPAATASATPAAVAAPMKGAPRRTRLKWGIGATATAALVVVAAIALRRHPLPPALDEKLVAVLPVSTPVGDSTLGAMAIRLGAFLELELGSGPPLRIAEPALVRAAWRRYAGGDTATDWRTIEDTIARATNAGLHLHTALERSVAGIRLSTHLDRMPGSIMGTSRTVEVQPEGLEATARILLLELEAEHFGQPRHRIAWLARRDPRAVRLFLEGSDNSGRFFGKLKACRAWVGRVLALDSGLVQSIDLCMYSTSAIWPYLGRGIPRDTLARLVWRRRGALPEEDRLFAEALYGPWAGLASTEEARIALWQRAADATDSWHAPWTRLAAELMTFGPLTSIPDWRGRAAAASSRAVEFADTNLIEPVRAAFWLRLFAGDTTSARTLLDAAVRRRLGAEATENWRHALDALRDGGTVDPYWVGHGGGRMRVVFAAAQALPPLAASADAAARHYADSAFRLPPKGDWLVGWVALYWRQRGRYANWLEARNRYYPFDVSSAGSMLDEIYDDMAVVQEVLYLGAPEDTLLRAAVGRMERIVRGDTVVPPGAAGIAHCWLSQWRLARGDTSGVGAAVRALRELDRRDRAGRQDGVTGGQRWVVCPAVLQAQQAALTGRGSLSAARALDALLRPLPMPTRGSTDVGDGSATHDQMFYVENYIAARLLAAAGDTAAALIAVRRHPRDFESIDQGFGLVEFLLEEGRYAAAMADTVGALTAYRHYLGLRVAASDHPPWRAQRDSVVAQVAALTRRGEKR
jgi:DNA-binding SARP family transcriptional activator